MSLRPGIGADAMVPVAYSLLRSKAELKDVPVSLRHGSKTWALGRYLRRRLRIELGRDASCSAPLVDEELRLVRAYAFRSGQSVSEVFEELAGGSPAYQARGAL